MFVFLKNIKFNKQRIFELGVRMQKLEDFIISTQKPKFSKLTKVKMKDPYHPYRGKFVVVGHKMGDDYSYCYELVTEDGRVELSVREYMIEEVSEDS